MLPSTGYFKTINCPFYNSGLCERPYCHFKHPRRDDSAANAAVPAVVVQSSASNVVDGTTEPNLFQQLVSQAVKKVLADHEVTGETVKIPDNIVSRVVGELKPASSSSSSSTSLPSVVARKEVLIATQPTTACVYNPTPIAELKKRHIPIAPYMPTKESKVAAKRKSSPERFKPWLSVPQDIADALDGGVAILPGYSTSKVMEMITYKPTAINSSLIDNAAPYARTYVPTVKSDSSSPNSYEDGNSSDCLLKGKDEYRPRSKKRREEYVPKKLKAPLKMTDEPATVAGFDTDITTILNAGIVGVDDIDKYDAEAEPKFSDDEIETPSVVVVAERVEKSNDEVPRRVTDSRTIVDPSEDDDKPKREDEPTAASETKSKESARRSSSEKREGERSRKDREKSREKLSKNDKDGRKDVKEVSNRETRGGEDKDKRRRSSSSSKDRRHSSSTSTSTLTGKSRKSSKDRGESSRREKHSSRSSAKEGDKKNEDKYKSNKKKSSSSSSSSSNKEDRRSSLENTAVDKRSKSRSRGKSRGSGSSGSTKREKDTDKNKKKNNDNDDDDDHDEKENSPLVSFRSSSPFSEEILEISDSDHDIEEECLKIFQEYEVSEHPKDVTAKQQQPRQLPDEPGDSGKQRIAHPSASQYAEWKRVPNKPAKVLKTPQVRLTERWRLTRDAILAEKSAGKTSTTAAPSSSSPANSTTSISNSQTADVTAAPSKKPSATNQPPSAKVEQLVNGNGRLRIAHVPYANSLALAKKKVSETMNKNQQDGNNKTVAQTAKGGSRVAHVPLVIPSLIRPEPLQVATQKFPLNVRQYYVNMMQDICIQIYTNGEDAAQRALREEYACHERCKAVAVYKSSCMLATHRLKKELDQRQSSVDFNSSPASGTVSHEAVLAGKSKGSWSVVKTKKSVTEFKGATLYTLLSKWIMTEEQLRDNGFPRPHPDGPTGRIKIYVTNTRNQTILSKQPNERFCSRCNQPYMVDKHGNAVVQQNCIYHWGRKFTIRGEGKYSCCQQYGSAGGCCDAKTHVWDYVDYENLRGYVKTLPKDYLPIEEQGVFALDCEMSYTTQGLELTRITVINEDCNPVYETLVKPVHPVIDYNTRFSGITEKDMEGVTTTLLDVQATLLSMFSDKTILIGHSLESDFKALKLVHDTVVDTSIMFPHRNGYPQKRALRNLCSEYLQKIIQNDVSGHDSNEDAVSCMELVLWRLKEEAKSQ